MHLLRNAVDHGIESPADRAAAGKSPTGRVIVRAYHEGTDVILEVEDDGRGLDLERIRRTVVERGYVEESEAAGLDQEALAAYLFEPGFSTADRVTEISGRGVGMDIVKAKVVHLNGRIRVLSRPGAGTTMVVRLPMTLAITRILLFRAGGELLGLPLGAVVQIVRPSAAAIVPLGTDRVVTIDGHTYPVRDLADWLGLPRPAKTPTARGRCSSRISPDATSRSRSTRSCTSRDAVVKPLGTHLRRVSGVWGATLLGDGTVVLILNPADLGGVAERRGRASPPRVPRSPRRSPTRADRRRLAQHAARAVGGRAARRMDPGPGARRPRGARGGPSRDAPAGPHPARRRDAAHGRLRVPRRRSADRKDFGSLPIVMLTSRGGEKHRDKAKALGATDYVVKPFQEDALIERIGRLIQASRHADRKVAS